MLSALFSINPVYVSKIFTGEKQYEFRKICCKSKIDKIVIYETSPICKIVGEVNVVGVLKERPEVIWNETYKLSGITYDFFKNYFKDKKLAYAYVLSNAIKYKTPISLAEIGIKAAPQSFIYLTSEQYNNLHRQL